ncbi:hypothetical protein [Fulvivirga ligni]|uniref:hypothetical protein n=1 Tax=Fulvivirga ligni TaxID=2904246 RepID=UPI001F3577F9|nr:hypothetical protein [Fulvivirga ligni]UII21960.1 hypothetical protein LVD16_01765 [Fulvivirga ligni]
MRVFLNIKITDNQFSYGNDVPVSPNNTSVLDLDNYSDDLTVSSMLKGLEQSEKAVVLIAVEDDSADVKSLFKIFKYLVFSKQPVKILYSQAHPLITNLLRPCKEKVLPLEDVENAITWLQD